MSSPSKQRSTDEPYFYLKKNVTMEDAVRHFHNVTLPAIKHSRFHNAPRAYADKVDDEDQVARLHSVPHALSNWVWGLVHKSTDLPNHMLTLRIRPARGHPANAYKNLLRVDMWVNYHPGHRAKDDLEVGKKGADELLREVYDSFDELRTVSMPKTSHDWLHEFRQHGAVGKDTSQAGPMASIKRSVKNILHDNAAARRSTKTTVYSTKSDMPRSAKNRSTKIRSTKTRRSTKAYSNKPSTKKRSVKNRSTKNRSTKNRSIKNRSTKNRSTKLARAGVVAKLSTKLFNRLSTKAKQKKVKRKTSVKSNRAGSKKKVTKTVVHKQTRQRAGLA